MRQQKKKPFLIRFVTNNRHAVCAALYHMHKRTDAIRLTIHACTLSYIAEARLPRSRSSILCALWMVDFPYERGGSEAAVFRIHRDRARAGGENDREL